MRHINSMDMEKIYQKARHIRLIAFDVDGILSDGKIIYDGQDIETKAFYVQDGVGIKALQQYGILTAIITGRNSPMVTKRANELAIDYVVQGRDDKRDALVELITNLDLTLEQCAYMGDDLPDIKALKAVGLSATVPNAHEEVKKYTDIITQHAGGQGAVREVCDIILKAQGHYDGFLAKFL